MYVWTYVRVCFPNWTGIVVEVKRGLVEEGWGGGSTGRAGRGFGALGEQQRDRVPYFKEALQPGQTLTPLTYQRNTHTLHIHIRWLFCLS